MMHAWLVQKMRLPLTALLVAASFAAQPASARMSGHAAAAIAHHGAAHTLSARHSAHPVRVALHMPHRPLGGSLVRCTLLSQPHRNERLTANRHKARYFAPTSQAVFFAHAGDRCVWHAGAAVHG